jgi:hypothetical protein
MAIRIAYHVSQTGGMTHIAMAAPMSRPNMKTTIPIAVFADWLGHSRPRGGLAMDPV